MLYPHVSILTPTYNRKRFIELCIFNLINQSYPLDKLEWFILDDSDEPYSSVELKHIEDNWFNVFNERIEDEILRKREEIDKKYNGKSRKNK